MEEIKNKFKSHGLLQNPYDRTGGAILVIVFRTPVISGGFGWWFRLAPFLLIVTVKSRFQPPAAAVFPLSRRRPLNL
jgi:hypothetical protein